LINNSPGKALRPCTQPSGCAADLRQIEATIRGCKTPPLPAMWMLFGCGLAVAMVVAQ
jgi:hypothetical protein